MTSAKIVSVHKFRNVPDYQCIEYEDGFYLVGPHDGPIPQASPKGDDGRVSIEINSNWTLEQQGAAYKRAIRAAERIGL